MDDNDVCPLCCEELDISDQQFFPCKCGYQVCMWCWHRIKESESGLCPACRTPYGDDPHEFSAVDMEEVVKANKEKAAAEKREKEKLRAQQAAAAGVSGAFGLAGMHIGGGSDGDLAVVTAGGSRGYLDPPKDRNQLAVMRVIRRNLVYAVGLPPSIATEDILRKPEYFGQYGKLSKIVLNRNHNGNGDPRRASASAYVTHAHKEDALACILALDGFYVDGRNIRASYGTSKYCSAFIKNVRCNNPDCTYLHGMGDSEDTFTKQEIQAGYVTSGRDVLARQQQLSAGTGARRRVGSGGPSNTGKVSSSPVFPPPTYEEPSKPSQSNLVPPPPPATSSTTQFPPVSSASLHRANSNTGIAGFSAVAAGNGPIPSLAGVAKMLRSSSLPLANTPSKPEPALTPAEMLSRQQEELRKKHPQNSTNTNRKKSSTTESANSQPTSAIPSAPAPASAGPAPPSTTAASIVAGVHTTSKPNAPPARHTTLTALTPLKRASSIPDKKDLSKSGNGLSSDILLSNNMPLSKGLSSSQQAAFLEQRKEAFISSGPPRDPSILHDTLRSNSTIFTNDTNKSINTDSAIAALKAPATPGIGSIGGKVIGGSSNVPISAPLGSFGNQNSSVGLSGLGNLNNSGHGGLLGSIGPSSLGGVGMSNVGGQPIGGFGGESNSGAIGGSNILSQPLLSNLGEIKANGNRPAGLFGNSDFGSIGGTGLWDQLGNNYPPRYPPAPSQGDNIAIGGSHLGGQPNTSNLGNNILSGNGLSGSSALASMLGIQLPTGVGSLRETLWASSTPLRGPSSDLKANAPTPIGAGIKKSSDGVIIGGHSSMNSAGSVPIGGYGTSVGPTSSGNQNDIALLQSLLPGVHINGGNTYQPAAPNTGGGGNPFGGSDWGGLGNSQPTHQSHHQYQQQEDSWNNGYSAAPGPPKQNNARNQPNIW